MTKRTLPNRSSFVLLLLSLVVAVVLVLLIQAEDSRNHHPSRILHSSSHNNNNNNNINSNKEFEERSRDRVGGWSLSPNLQDEDLIRASDFTLEQLVAATTSTTTTTTSTTTASPDPTKEFSKDFLNTIADNSGVKGGGGGGGGLQIIIVHARQQVVAGMNYLMTLVVISADSDKTSAVENCLGAYEATVYDAFGNLSVTHWGKEYTLEEAKALLVDFYASSTRDADEGDVN